MRFRPSLPLMFGACLCVATHGFAAPPVMPGADRNTTAATTPADVAADLDFLLQAWQANARELAAARLALERSRDVRVRQFAQDLVRGHSAANRKFHRLAAQRGLGIPAAVRDVQAAQAFGLEGLRGVAFDRRFAAAAGVEAHRDAIALYRQQVDQGRDAALVRLAADDLPMLRMHLARAEALQAQFELRRRNAPSR